MALYCTGVRAIEFLNPKIVSLNPKNESLNATTESLNPKIESLNLNFESLNPKVESLHPMFHPQLAGAYVFVACVELIAKMMRFEPRGNSAEFYMCL